MEGGGLPAAAFRVVSTMQCGCVVAVVPELVAHKSSYKTCPWVVDGQHTDHPDGRNNRCLEWHVKLMHVRARATDEIAHLLGASSPVRRR